MATDNSDSHSVLIPSTMFLFSYAADASLLTFSIISLATLFYSSKITRSSEFSFAATTNFGAISTIFY